MHLRMGLILRMAKHGHVWHMLRPGQTKAICFYHPRVWRYLRYDPPGKGVCKKCAIRYQHLIEEPEVGENRIN